MTKIQKISAWFLRHQTKIFVVVLAILTVAVIEKTFQNDTYSAIVNGEYIAEHGVDDVEPFTIHDGLKYVKLRWAFDLVMYAVHSIGGFPALYVFLLCFAYCIALAIFFIAKKMTKNSFAAFLFTGLYFVLTTDMVALRAQSVSYLIFLLEAYLLYRYRETRSPRPLALITVLGLILLAFHASVWIVYLAIFLPFLVAPIFSRKRCYPIALLLLFEVMLIAGTITPLGLTPYTYPFRMMIGGTVSSTIITELFPSSIMALIPFIVIAALFLLAVIFNRKRLCLEDLFMLCGMSVFAIIARRNVEPALFALIPTTLNIVTALHARLPKIKNDAVVFCFQIVFPVSLIITFTAVSIKWIIADQEVDFVSKGEPVSAADYIVKNLDLSTYRGYNSFNAGAYLDYRGIPTFIDSRSEVYEKQFGGGDIIEDFKRFGLDDTFEYQKVLVEKYDLNYLLVEHYPPLIKYLRKETNYKELYSDENFTLYQVN